MVGDGTQSRDFTYVNDVVRAFYIAAKSKVKNKIYNVGSNKTIRVKTIIKYLEGKHIRIPKRPAEPDITFANITKIKKDLKWKPKVDIKLGIKLLLKNLDYWNKAPVWTKQSIKKATKNWFKYLK